MREILIAGAIALFMSLFGTPVLIRILAKKGYGQIIRDDGPSSHHTNRGTPTMGGIIIIFASLVGYFLSHIVTRVNVSISALLVIGLIISLGSLGFTDDWLKVSRQKSLGLTGRQKILGQTIFAAIFGALGIHFADKDGFTPLSLYLSTVRDTSLKLGAVLVVIWIVIMVTSTSNGVNLTDGLDGLATGASVMTFLAFLLIGVWEFGEGCAITPGLNCYQVRDPLDLAVLSASLAGSCTGFLWWNASPAKIFMGDTGSLALGGALAGLAATLRTQLLLVPLGGLFVIITASVIIQRLYFKMSGGKRVFKMAPLQHHFELSGWGEVTIVIRFWIVAGLCVAFGLGLFYAQWVVS
ncbi:MAG: phospho-N-acetylmuramoyl-pentapeptide-transferase [Candidatus Nanopelagicaceae bacterium]|nr:phospho-N-acetylmuramoyl-pentapeptide-transferase [Candidatus Nanopelagicaceae bacterium]